jgi:HflK protein
VNFDAMASIVVSILVFKIGLEVTIAALQGLAKEQTLTFEGAAVIGSVPVPARWVAYVREAQPTVLGVAVRHTRRLRDTLSRRRKTAAAAVLVLVVGGYAASGVYLVAPDEIGVVLRCGKLFRSDVPPGLHYRLPSPITALYRVKPQAVRQLEFGFRTVAQRGEVNEPSAYLWESSHRRGIYEKVLPEAIMLTGDKNEVDLNLSIEYRVADHAAPSFLFQLARPEHTVRAFAESCVRRVVGSMVLTDVLTIERQVIEARVRDSLQDLLDVYGAGVEITAVYLQDVHPPVEVVPAFRRVATAREDRATAINRAIAHEKATIPKSRGLANYIRADAQAYLAEKKLEAEGEAGYFSSMSGAFQDQPRGAAYVMYIRSLEEALSPVRKVILSEEAAAGITENPLETYFLAGEFLKDTPPPPSRPPEAQPEELQPEGILP